jgi:hypothetical protein
VTEPRHHEQASTLHRLFTDEPAQRLVSAAAAGRARLHRQNSTPLARGAYLQRRSRCPLQTVLGSFMKYSLQTSFTSLIHCTVEKFFKRFFLITVVSPILFKHHIWWFLENQNAIYGGRFLKNFA